MEGGGGGGAESGVLSLNLEGDGRAWYERDVKRVLDFAGASSGNSRSCVCVPRAHWIPRVHTRGVTRRVDLRDCCEKRKQKELGRGRGSRRGGSSVYIATVSEC